MSNNNNNNNSNSYTISDYQIVKHLGSGTYGTCSVVRLRSDRGSSTNNNNKLLAWKEIDYRQFSESELRLLCQEVNLLRALKHPHVVSYQGRILDTGTSRIYVLMEYCPNGDLGALIAALAGSNRLVPSRLAPESFVRRVCVQLLSALAYCHAAAVIHRDLKPANVLLDAGWNAKLADFGLSRVLSSMQSLATSFVGSPMYMSPELLGEDGFTTPKSDVWALGCLLHELMALKAPFSARSAAQLCQEIRAGIRCRLPVTYSTELRCLTAEMLQLDQATRPSAGELLARPLLQPWAAAAAADKPWSEAAAAAAAAAADGNELKETTREKLQLAHAGHEDPHREQGGGNEATDGRTMGSSERRELLELQQQLTATQSRLLAAEADLEERRKRFDQATAATQERLNSWEARLMRLHESLEEKQKLLQIMASSGGGGSAASAVAATAASPQQQPKKPPTSRQRQQQQQANKRHNHHHHQQQQLRRTALQDINLSPIVTAEPAVTAAAQAIQQQQRKPAAAAAADGKYSPILAQPAPPPPPPPVKEASQTKPPPQPQLGSYEPPLPPVSGPAQKQQRRLQQVAAAAAAATRRGKAVRPIAAAATTTTTTADQ